MRQKGFSLVEVAVVLVILSILIVAVGIPAGTQRESDGIGKTNITLRDAKDALAGFVMANGRLPCPATVDGFENVVSTSTGECAAYSGFYPGATLGITPVNEQGFLVDGWNNPIRYAVADVTATQTLDPILLTPVAPCAQPTSTHIFTKTNGVKTVTMGCAATLAAIKVCAASSTGADTLCPVQENPGPPVTAPTPGPPENLLLTTHAPYILWSTGAQSASRSLDESQNATGTSVFVSRTRRDYNGWQFDDIVVYESWNSLVSWMVKAGMLP
jgi:prepilin-type N-terminal cleavage/methylation domain-containing protein